LTYLTGLTGQLPTLFFFFFSRSLFLLSAISFLIYAAVLHHSFLSPPSGLQFFSCLLHSSFNSVFISSLSFLILSRASSFLLSCQSLSFFCRTGGIWAEEDRHGLVDDGGVMRNTGETGLHGTMEVRW
jgi:hypothetical protein